jgi:hypothetical protein
VLTSQFDWRTYGRAICDPSRGSCKICLNVPRRGQTTKSRGALQPRLRPAFDARMIGENAGMGAGASDYSMGEDAPVGLVVMKPVSVLRTRTIGSNVSDRESDMQDGSTWVLPDKPHFVSRGIEYEVAPSHRGTVIRYQGAQGDVKRMKARPRRDRRRGSGPLRSGKWLSGSSFRRQT